MKSSIQANILLHVHSQDVNQNCHVMNIALHQHIVTHDDQKFKYTICNKMFNTEPNLKQYLRGKHGKGFIALCSAVYDCSNGRNEHQVECV